jgi:predicted membrane channel-forming protein YqfA (hemolysin III family)
MFPVYWAGTQWGSKPFGIPSPSTIRTEKLDPRKMVVAIGIMILMGVLVLAVYSALLDFANWVFQTQNVLLFLYEGSLLTLLGILLILWRIISRKEKHP